MQLSKAALWVLLLPGVAAAQVYKIVGPDGKITYSDRPPIEASASVQMIKAGGPVPVADRPAAADVAASGAANAADRAAAAGGRAAKHAIRSEPGGGSPAEDNNARRMRIQLLNGLQVVLGNMALVDQTIALCGSTLPTSAKKYDAAASLWKSRNGDVVNRANAVLSSALSGAERAELDMVARQRTDAMLQVVKAADTQRRIAWCDKSAGEMSSGAMDLARMSGVDAVLRYQAP